MDPQREMSKGTFAKFSSRLQLWMEEFQETFAYLGSYCLIWEDVYVSTHKKYLSCLLPKILMQIT